MNLNLISLEKHIIDQILAQPGCVGIRFFDAINEAGDKNFGVCWN